MSAHLCRHSSHTRSAERIEDKVARLRIVQYVGDDAARRNLSVVGMGVVDRVVLAFFDIRRERRTFVIIGRRVVWVDVPGEKVRKLYLLVVRWHFLIL